MSEMNWLLVLLIGGAFTVTAAGAHDSSLPQYRRRWLVVMAAGAATLCVGFMGVALT